jgi:hypothetical protein
VLGNGGWLWLSSTRVCSRNRVTYANPSNEELKTDVCAPKTKTSKLDSSDKRTSHLDGLLEKRMRPLRAQARAMVVVEQHVQRFFADSVAKQCALLPQGTVADDNRVRLLYRCYSAACNAGGKNAPLCYSALCRARSVLVARDNSDTENSKKEESSAISHPMTACDVKPEKAKPASIDCIDSRIVYNVDTRLPVSVGRLSGCAGTVPRKSNGRLPAANSFATRSHRKSIFVLEQRHLSRLARRGGLRFEPPGFAHHLPSKSECAYWPYPAPRPLFCTAWYYRTATVQSLAAFALQLRVFRCCLRWDDMQARRPSSPCEETDPNFVTRTELIDKRDVLPDGLRSEYLVQRIMTHVGGNSEARG